MKTIKILLLNAALLCAFSTFAQTESGRVMLGGTAGFDVQFEDEHNIVSIDVQPQLGFFILDNLAVGSGLALVSLKQGDDFKSTAFGILPFGRYYFGSGNTRFFVQAHFGYTTAKTEFFGEESTSSGTQIGGGPGVAFFLNNHVAIEGLLAYDIFGGDLDGENLGLRIGVQAYLGGE
ncbi:MAG: outer membrane beta-barrel protein [Bacteroidetes bacterium]|nr:outer membrane beta-barrel protein [Bacteroidota bacterium]